MSYSALGRSLTQPIVTPFTQFDCQYGTVSDVRENHRPRAVFDTDL